MINTRIKVLSLATFFALLATALSPLAAMAGDCDGTNLPDTINCTTSPSTGGDVVIGLDAGDDTFTLGSAADSGSVVGDGTTTGGQTAGNGGDDRIVINGDVNVGGTPQVIGDNVSGDGGDDTIIVNGTVSHTIWADDAGGDGGDDTIIINGSLTGSLVGDNVSGDGGDDTIIINGSAASIFGDDAGGVGGDDYIEINGSAGDIHGEGGADQVVLGEDASVTGTIDGGAGNDTLTFDALTQSQADALNPAGGSITINGHTYTWLNFENLLGMLAELIERGLHVFFANDSVLAIEANAGNGISIFAEHGRIAFVSYASLANLDTGDSASYNTPKSLGWYVTVVNLGADPNHAAKTLYQVNVYNAGGGLAGQFTFWN
jgi:hypothetical protein